MLLQLLRGAGPEGLAAMAVRTGRLLRPLLGVRRAETRACCAPPGWPGARTRPTPATGRCATGPAPPAPPAGGAAPRRHPGPGPHPALAADERDWLDPLVATALAAAATPTQPVPQPGAVDSREPPVPPSVTLPVGAPPSRGRGAGRPEPGGLALDARALAELPVALGRRVVREAARRAGATVPDAAATDRVLALAGAADGAGTGWAGGSAAREGIVVRLQVPPD